MTEKVVIGAVAVALALVVGLEASAARSRAATPKEKPAMSQKEAQGLVGNTEPLPAKERVVKSEAEWKKLLPADVFQVTRRKGTEIAFTGKYWNQHQHGVYLCADCGYELFSSDTKFDSGTGWPSFWAPVARSHVRDITDDTYGMERVEVVCNRCDAHLGHVFDDGPAPTGLRYCMNSASLKFVAK